MGVKITIVLFPGTTVAFMDGTMGEMVQGGLAAGAGAGEETVELMRCSLCKCCVLKEEMRQHTAEHFSHLHSEQQFVCDLCGESFQDRIMLGRHKYKHKLAAIDEKVQCSQCSKIYTSMHSLRQHEKIHKDERVTCEVCSKSYSNIFAYKKHKKKFHDGIINEHICTTCGDAFEMECKLKEHEYELHGLGHRFDCSKCEKICYTKLGFERHAYNCMKGKAEKIFECKLCGKTYKQESHLIAHKASHTGVKNHKCDVCQKKFMYQSSVINHKKSAHGMTAKESSIPAALPNSHLTTPPPQPPLSSIARETGAMSRLASTEEPLDSREEKKYKDYSGGGYNDTTVYRAPYSGYPPALQLGQFAQAMETMRTGFTAQYYHDPRNQHPN